MSALAAASTLWFQMVWNGGADDYPNSTRIGGKERKVRSLAKALRLLAA